MPSNRRFDGGRSPYAKPGRDGGGYRERRAPRDGEWTSHEVVTGPVTALLSVPVIDPVIGSRSGLGSVSVIDQVIDPENASVIVRKSGSATVPVPSTEVRTPPVQTLRTNALGLDVFAIATIVMATAVVQAMNDANRPSAPDLALMRLVLSGRMQHRRLQRPLRQRTI